MFRTRATSHKMWWCVLKDSADANNNQYSVDVSRIRSVLTFTLIVDRCAIKYDQHSISSALNASLRATFSVCHSQFVCNYVCRISVPNVSRDQWPTRWEDESMKIFWHLHKKHNTGIPQVQEEFLTQCPHSTLIIFSVHLPLYLTVQITVSDKSVLSDLSTDMHTTMLTGMIARLEYLCLCWSPWKVDDHYSRSDDHESSESLQFVCQIVQ